MNALNINSSHSPTKFCQPANLTTYTILCLFSLHDKTRSSSAVTPARPSVSSSLQITNCTLRYASPFLWNQPLLHSVNLILFTPHSSPHPTHITASRSPPSLSPSMAPLAFHSRLKLTTFTITLRMSA